MAELALSVADKVKLKPKHAQAEINEVRREFEEMRAGWRKQRAKNLNGITETKWDEAMQQDLQVEEQGL
jgi:predicted phage gp36 major capsid-like protein